MGKLSRHQKGFEKFNREIYKLIVTTKNALIEKNRIEVKENTIKLESHKSNLENDLAKIVSEKLQEGELDKYTELEQEVRNTLTDISAVLCKTWDYLEINGPLLTRKELYLDLECEFSPKFEEPIKKHICTYHRLAGPV